MASSWLYNIPSQAGNLSTFQDPLEGKMVVVYSGETSYVVPVRKYDRIADSTPKKTEVGKRSDAEVQTDIIRSIQEHRPPGLEIASRVDELARTYASSTKEPEPDHCRLVRTLEKSWAQVAKVPELNPARLHSLTGQFSYLLDLAFKFSIIDEKLFYTYLKTLNFTVENSIKYVGKLPQTISDQYQVPQEFDNAIALLVNCLGSRVIPYLHNAREYWNTGDDVFFQQARAMIDSEGDGLEAHKRELTNVSGAIIQAFNEIEATVEAPTPIEHRRHHTLYPKYLNGTEKNERRKKIARLLKLKRKPNDIALNAWESVRDIRKDLLQSLGDPSEPLNTSISTHATNQALAINLIVNSSPTTQGIDHLLRIVTNYQRYIATLRRQNFDTRLQEIGDRWFRVETLLPEINGDLDTGYPERIQNQARVFLATLLLNTNNRIDRQVFAAYLNGLNQDLNIIAKQEFTPKAIARFTKSLETKMAEMQSHLGYGTTLAEQVDTLSPIFTFPDPDRKISPRELIYVGEAAILAMTSEVIPFAKWLISEDTQTQVNATLGAISADNYYTAYEDLRATLVENLDCNPRNLSKIAKTTAVAFVEKLTPTEKTGLMVALAIIERNAGISFRKLSGTNLDFVKLKQGDATWGIFEPIKNGFEAGVVSTLSKDLSSQYRRRMQALLDGRIYKTIHESVPNEIMTQVIIPALKTPIKRGNERKAISVFQRLTPMVAREVCIAFANEAERIQDRQFSSTGWYQTIKEQVDAHRNQLEYWNNIMRQIAAIQI